MKYKLTNDQFRISPISKPRSQYQLDVRLEVETVWLIQAQMAQMLGKGRSTITEPIIYINLFHIAIWNNDFLRFFWCLNYGSR